MGNESEQSQSESQSQYRTRRYSMENGFYQLVRKGKERVVEAADRVLKRDREKTTMTIR